MNAYKELKVLWSILCTKNLVTSFVTCRIIAYIEISIYFVVSGTVLDRNDFFHHFEGEVFL